MGTKTAWWRRFSEMGDKACDPSRAHSMRGGEEGDIKEDEKEEKCVSKKKEEK